MAPVTLMLLTMVISARSTELMFMISTVPMYCDQIYLNATYFGINITEMTNDVGFQDRFANLTHSAIADTSSYVANRTEEYGNGDDDFDVRYISIINASGILVIEEALCASNESHLNMSHTICNDFGFMISVHIKRALGIPVDNDTSWTPSPSSFCEWIFVYIHNFTVISAKTLSQSTSLQSTMAYITEGAIRDASGVYVPFDVQFRNASNALFIVFSLCTFEQQRLDLLTFAITTHSANIAALIVTDLSAEFGINNNSISVAISLAEFG